MVQLAVYLIKHFRPLLLPKEVQGRHSSQASSSLGPFTVTSSTKKVDTRARARAIALKIENTSTNQSWKLGTFRLDTQPDGRR